MYFGDHVPPPFHALYAEFETLIDIQTLVVIGGNYPDAQWHLYWSGRSNIEMN
jgi:hypothetical protein